MVLAQVMLFGDLFVGDFGFSCRGGGGLFFVRIFDGWIGFVWNRQCFQISSPSVAGWFEEVAVFSARPEWDIPFLASVFHPEGVRRIFNAHEGYAAR